MNRCYLHTKRCSDPPSPYHQLDSSVWNVERRLLSDVPHIRLGVDQIREGGGSNGELNL